MKPNVRIAGGIYRGKKIYFSEARGLRPTPDRVKVTLFNWLMHDVRGARCLDAYAGSGALGFEAFSRGAAQVDMVEASPVAFKALKKNASEFKSSVINIFHADASQFLSRIKEAYDLIFLDPPFDGEELQKASAIIFSDQCIKPGGLLYVESRDIVHPPADNWTVLKSKKAGQVFYALFQRKNPVM